MISVYLLNLSINVMVSNLLILLHNEYIFFVLMPSQDHENEICFLVNGLAIYHFAILLLQRSIWMPLVYYFNTVLALIIMLKMNTHKFRKAFYS